MFEREREEINWRLSIDNSFEEFFSKKKQRNGIMTRVVKLLSVQWWGNSLAGISLRENKKRKSENSKIYNSFEKFCFKEMG